MKPVTVSQINAYIKRVLQSDPLLGDLVVIGEIANLKYHSSGHVYFTLKDANSKISCFLPASVLAHLRYELTEGMEIIAYSSVGVYERGGTYSLTIRDIEVQGKGNLAAAFEALKAKLNAEGLFDPKRKKPIPRFPKRIGIVTSPTGAAVHDCIKIIRDRNQFVDVVVCPVLVQGPDAAADIANGIRILNEKFPDMDVMIVGRGGGSQEELWAFNEEIVARAIDQSNIPVISAVGHEIDFSISDFVSDVRAATPTEAAVLATENVTALAEQAERLRVDLYQTGLLDRIRSKIAETVSAGNQLFYEYEKRWSQKEQSIQMYRAVLEERSPYTVLNRGYAVLLDENGKTVKSTSDVKTGSQLTAILKDGKLSVTVIEDQK